MPCSVYLLRHEVRYLADSTFLTELYPNGKRRAGSSLKELLKKCNIGFIHCSPFLRVLQTVGPFAEESNLPLRVDYRLAESLVDPHFLEKPSLELTPDMISQYKIRDEHVFEYNWREKLKFPESGHAINARVWDFVRDVSSHYKVDFRGHGDAGWAEAAGGSRRNCGEEQGKNVLVVTHMDNVNVQLGIWRRYAEFLRDYTKAEEGGGQGENPTTVEREEFFAGLRSEPAKAFSGLYKMGCLATMHPESGELLKLNEGFNSEDGDDHNFDDHNIIGNGASAS